MDDLDLIDEQPLETNKRPVFLKVLCILTFVGSGITILGALLMLLMFGMVRTGMQQINRFGSPFDSSNNVDVDQIMQWFLYSNISNLAGGILCLTGALIMWRLKKIGFSIYTIGTVIPLIIGFVALPYMSNLSTFGSSTAGAIFSAMISAAFVIMYGLNLKHLK